MIADSSRGFTIIEVMLFLAISGLMVAGMLSGVGNNVSNQNYREGVNDLRNFIQGQFDGVYNLTSDNVGLSDNPCSSSDLTARGRSDCLYVGRILHFQPPDIPGGGSSIEVNPVVAELKIAHGPGSTLFGGLEGGPASALSYQLSDYRISAWRDGGNFSEKYMFNWQLTGYTPNGMGYSPTLNTRASILILRSPVDGSVRSYKIPNIGSVYSSIDSSPHDLTEADSQNPAYTVLGSPNAGNDTVVCVVDRGSSSNPEILAVKIAGDATGPGDVEVVSNQIITDSGGLKC